MKLKKSQYKKMLLTMAIISAISAGLLIFQIFYRQTIEKEIADLSVKVEEIKEAGGFEKLTKQIKDLNSKINELTNQKQEIMQENPDLTQHIQELNNLFQEAKEYNDELMRSTAGDYNKLLEKYNNLEKKCKELEDKIQTLKEKNEG